MPRVIPRRGTTGKMNDGGMQSLKPHCLVEILAHQRHFRASLLFLHETEGLEHKNVKRLIDSYPKIFCLQDEIVELWPELRVCSTHQDHRKCKWGKKCRNLHICRDYLGGQCDEEDCSLGHQWTVEPNSYILYRCFLERLPTEAVCKLAHMIQTDVDDTDEPRNLTDEVFTSTEDESSDEKDPMITDEGSGEDSDSSFDDLNQHVTIFSTNQIGEVKEPKICYYSVESQCRDEKSGCLKLHADKHYHWQAREQKGSYHNLPAPQVDALERAYCNPEIEKIYLPPLNGHSYGPLILGLHGSSLEADLETMELISDDDKKLELRRLCTEYIEGTDVDARTFMWYFLADDMKWTLYGTKTNTNSLRSNVTSEEIEQQYSQNSSSAIFANERFSYTLNFKTMMQTNDDTNGQREVRRRPKPHLPEMEDDQSINLPPTWDRMDPDVNNIQIALNPFTPTYQEIISLLEPNIPSDRVAKIERIQNPRLWIEFEKKVSQMANTHGKPPNFLIRKLFFATSYRDVELICKEDFDKSIQSNHYGNEYGQGIYFFSDPYTASEYCERDQTNFQYLLIAQVAVGLMIRGEPIMNEPFINIDDGTVYDTSVDDDQNPTIFVKYKKDECYPEYIITLRPQS